MINPKYYQDIKKFPDQFKTGFDLAKDLKLQGEFDKVVLCGMGGSALFVELINDYLSSDNGFRINVKRGYNLPKYANEKTLFLIVSHSGNTEETYSCLEEAEKNNYKYIIMTSGGRLLEYAKTNNSPYVLMPSGIQPRLSTGYFIGSILKILSNMGFISDKEAEITTAATKINHSLDEEKAKAIAKTINSKVPVIYSTDNNSSIAMVSKIKFNENTKTQAFWNFFPELNHNEMVGFTNLVMNPFFIIYSSKFAHSRHSKRIEVFAKIMRDKGVPVEIIGMQGDSNIEEILNAYYFIDHVTFYLSEEYGVDPEPVALVEEFKKMI